MPYPVPQEAVDLFQQQAIIECIIKLSGYLIPWTVGENSDQGHDLLTALKRPLDTMQANIRKKVRDGYS